MSRRATWIHPGPWKSWACSVASTVSAGRPCSSSPTTRRLAPRATGSSGCVTGGSSTTSAWRTWRLPHDGRNNARSRTSTRRTDHPCRVAGRRHKSLRLGGRHAGSHRVLRAWRGEVGDWCPMKWRARQDSNLRPLGPEPNALSTELQARERQGYRSRAERRRRQKKPRPAPEGTGLEAVPVKETVETDSSATRQGHLSRRLHRLP